MRSWPVLVLPVSMLSLLAACGSSSTSLDGGASGSGNHSGANSASGGSTPLGSGGTTSMSSGGAGATNPGNGGTTTAGATAAGGGAGTTTAAGGTAGSAGATAVAGAAGAAAGSTAGGNAGATGNAGAGGKNNGGAGGTAGGAVGSGGAQAGGGGKSSGGTGGTAGGTTSTGTAQVLQHHNNPSRDGLYVDNRLTKAAAGTLHIDTTFANATLAGPTYAQPLYLLGTGGKPDLVIAVTEQNHIKAVNAANGMQVYDQTLGMTVPQSQLASLRANCGNINPLGITGTPIIDAATRTIYLDTMTAMTAGGTAQHMVFALDADLGVKRDGWPVDLNATAKSGNLTFSSLAQNQRGALALLDGKVFVPFGGHIGDCGNYHGWVVGISTTNPTQVSAWATRAIAGGIWAPAGIAVDGTSLVFATGNTQATTNSFTVPTNWAWQDGETIFKLPSSLAFSNNANDYFVPQNYRDLDNGDTDIGGTAPIIVTAGGTKLVVQLGKDRKAYVRPMSALGGLQTAATGTQVAGSAVITAAAGYTTSSGTFVVFKDSGTRCPAGQSGGLTAIKVTAAGAASVAWCGGPTTSGAPAVSVTDAQGSNAVVWIVGTDNKLYGVDGETGTSILAGTAAMSAVAKFQTPIVANGRVFVAANNQIYAFTP